MKRFSYGERDYAFGQRMLTLRTTIGLTQADLAEHLGISRKAVGGWEAGESYPKAQRADDPGHARLGLSCWTGGRGDPGLVEGSTPEGAPR